MEIWKDNRVVYEGKIVTLRIGDATLDDGSLAHREVIEHGGGVGVAAVVDGHVILVRQYRIAVGKDVLEIPAGRLEPGEDPETSARRELREEVGLEGGTLVHVASCYCSPGFTNELDHIYIASGLKSCAAEPEYDENLEIVRLPLDEARAMLERHEFDDAKTIIALRELFAWLEEHHTERL